MNEQAQRPLRIMMYSGLVVERDAISGSVRAKAGVLDRWAAEGRAVEWQVRCMATDMIDPRVRAQGLKECLLDPEVWAADVHLFEFGIYYELFDLVFALKPSTPAIAFYHNITPLHLVADEEVRADITKSIRQRSNLSACAHVVSDSEFNRDELVGHGFDAERMSVLHLPPAIDLRRQRGRRGSMHGGIPTLLFVGRFVSSKGLFTLLDALARVRRDFGGECRTILAGTSSFQDVETSQAVADAARDGLVDIVRDPDDDALAELYLAADLFVMPSRHEGYCVPIVEALSAGCQIVSTDAGNLPYIVGELGQIVPVDDDEALANAIVNVLASLADGGVRVRARDEWMQRSTWIESVDRHLTAHDMTAFDRGLDVVLAKCELAVRDHERLTH